jgi:isopenicillin-N N-acyltransferase like protein
MLGTEGVVVRRINPAHPMTIHPCFARSVLVSVACSIVITAPVMGDPTDPAKGRFIGGQSVTAPAIEVRSEALDAQSPGGAGYRFAVTNAESRVPVVVVGGTSHQMGWHLGRLMKSEINQFLPPTLEGFKKKLKVSDQELDRVWASTAAFTDDRFEQELVGLAEGSGLPVRSVQHAHCLPLLMPYSCSSIAAWGAATRDGHLYQTRNLDWTLEARAHDFPALVVYLPEKGQPHVLPTFAGMIGANCGMSAAGIALSEMGDSPAREMPYNLHAPHFTAWFRTVLNDADSLTSALDIFRRQPQTKRYHFVFGDGRTEKRAVKILSHSVVPAPGNLRIWKDNDPTDELAPSVLDQIVYQDEGRGAFPTLREQHGALDPEKLMALACQIPIKGGNVLDALFDATDLRLWVSYASGDLEAYKRPFVFLDLRRLDGDNDGTPDLEEAALDRNKNRIPDFLDSARATSAR